MIDQAERERSGGPLHALLRRAVDVRPDEVRALLPSFVFFFFLLSSYFVLRPIREQPICAACHGADAKGNELMYFEVPLEKYLTAPPKSN